VSEPIAKSPSRPAAEPTSPPVAEPPVDPESRALPARTDRTEGPTAIPVGSPAGRVIDAALTTDKSSLRADGKSLAYLTVHVVDAHGVQVPDADNPIHVSVSGAGTFAGADNGKEDDAEGYKSTTHDAFNGLMLAIAQASTRPGPIDVTVASPGLHGAQITLRSTTHPTTSTHAAAGHQLPASPPAPPPSSLAPTADASFSGGVFSGFDSDFGVSTTLPFMRLNVLTVASPSLMPATTTSPLSASGCWRTTT